MAERSWTDASDLGLGNSVEDGAGVRRPVYLCVFSSTWWLWLVLQPILKQSPVNEVYIWSDLANSL